MKRATILGAVVASMTAATSAQATEHVVMILPDAYFPEITYLDPGDTIRFVNISGETHFTVAKNADWWVGPIGPEEERTISIDGDMQKEFYSVASILDFETNDLGEDTVSGEVSFAPAPLD